MTLAREPEEIRRALVECGVFNETTLEAESLPWKPHWYEAWEEHARHRILPIFAVLMGWDDVRGIGADSQFGEAVEGAYVSGWNACLVAVANLLGITVREVVDRLEATEGGGPAEGPGQ